MVYSAFAIESLKERLCEKAMKSATPKKFAVDMFEAYEVIRQLQAELKKCETEMKKREAKTPCDLCGNGPASGMDGKPCTVCPAFSKEGTS